MRSRKNMDQNVLVLVALLLLSIMIVVLAKLSHEYRQVSEIPVVKSQAASWQRTQGANSLEHVVITVPFKDNKLTCLIVRKTNNSSSAIMHCE